jgi:choline dehydrogenase-like flavoprotein
VRGAKGSTLKTCLEDAAANGARIVVNAWARNLVVEGGRCGGVVAVLPNSVSLAVRARCTVVAGGAIGTPALLLRSGVRGQVGRNLSLHPVTAVWGRFDAPVCPWTGTLQAMYSDQFADMDDGYGVRFETAPVHPSLIAMAMPWENAAHYDSLVARLAHMSLVGVLTRDRSTGRVRLKRDGSPLVQYAVSSDDQKHIRRGAIAAAQVLAAAGADEVFVSQNRFAPWHPSSEPLDAWISQLDRIGFGSNRALYVSFHQMGTCRMGRDPTQSVVDGSGQTHAVRDLYVADASLFPSASGVNPMLTVSALAHYVARELKQTLR